MRKRVVITGMGAITPIGNDVKTFWQNLKSKIIGIGPITYFDTADYKAKLAAQVKNFDAQTYMDVKISKRMEPFCQFALAAAGEAIQDAQLDLSKEDLFRVGVSVGSGIGSLQAIEREYRKLITKGPRRVAPLLVPLMISNMAAANISIYYGMKGKCLNIATACATGTNSIGEAFRTIQYGDADVMIAGGTEACITPLGIAGFTSLTALNTTDDPTRASIPFDLDRKGFVMGEGAGIIILETLEHAQARGAKIYAEIAGYGSTGDAYHITSPAEDGSGAAKAMSLAIADAGLQPEDVDYINAHGSGTHHNDLFETKAIKRVFGNYAFKLKINSTKSMIGHMLGAAGSVEFIVCVKSIENSFIHATAGLEKDDPECDLNYTKGNGTTMDISCAISNSLGFGGHNATLLVKKFED